MSIRIVFRGTAFALALSVAIPAQAGWKFIAGNQLAKVDALAVTPNGDWSQSTRRLGKHGIGWTKDGFELNSMEFFSGVPNGQPLYKEVNKKTDPMPKFDNAILLPELADFFERSLRAKYPLAEFVVEEAGPATLGGRRALQVKYRYILKNDDLHRQGFARLAVVDGKLYAANYAAPRLHYYEAGLAEATAMMDGIRF
jgi:hypothetical protein